MSVTSESESHSVLFDSFQPPRPGNSPGQNTGVGCHFLLQGIFPTQGSNSHFCVSCIGRQILYHCATWEAPLWKYQMLQKLHTLKRLLLSYVHFFFNKNQKILHWNFKKWVECRNPTEMKGRCWESGWNLFVLGHGQGMFPPSLLWVSPEAVSFADGTCCPVPGLWLKVQGWLYSLPQS